MVKGLLSIPSVMDMYDTSEMFSRYYVDPVIAQQHVPSKWKVKIHENGMALLYVLVQECHKMLNTIFGGTNEEDLSKVPDTTRNP